VRQWRRKGIDYLLALKGALAEKDCVRRTNEGDLQPILRPIQGDALFRSHILYKNAPVLLAVCARVLGGDIRMVQAQIAPGCAANENPVRGRLTGGLCHYVLAFSAIWIRLVFSPL
jgi:hypothetical protein